MKAIDDDRNKNLNSGNDATLYTFPPPLPHSQIVITVSHSQLIMTTKPHLILFWPQLATLGVRGAHETHANPYEIYANTTKCVFQGSEYLGR